MKSVQRILITTALIGLATYSGQALAYGKGPMHGGCQQGYGPMPYYGPYRPMPPAHHPAPMMRPPVQAMPYAQPYQQPYAQQYQQTSVQQVAGSEKPAESADSASVSISQMQFMPARIVVKKGGTVTWSQVDAMPHTVTARDGSCGSQPARHSARSSTSQGHTATTALFIPPCRLSLRLWSKPQGRLGATSENGPRYSAFHQCPVLARSSNDVNRYR